MTDKLWKQAERRVAALLGGERVPVTGRQRGDAPDIEHGTFSVEVKHKQSLPDWLKDAMEQAEEAGDGNKLPIVILHEKGKTYNESLTLLRLSSIIKLYNRLQDLEDEVKDLQSIIENVEETR